MCEVIRTEQHPVYIAALVCAPSNVAALQRVATYDATYETIVMIGDGRWEQEEKNGSFSRSRLTK